MLFLIIGISAGVCTDEGMDTYAVAEDDYCVLGLS